MFPQECFKKTQPIVIAELRGQSAPLDTVVDIDVVGSDGHHVTTRAYVVPFVAEEDLCLCYDDFLAMGSGRPSAMPTPTPKRLEEHITRSWPVDVAPSQTARVGEHTNGVAEAYLSDDSLEVSITIISGLASAATLHSVTCESKTGPVRPVIQSGPESRQSHPISGNQGVPAADAARVTEASMWPELHDGASEVEQTIETQTSPFDRAEFKDHSSQLLWTGGCGHLGESESVGAFEANDGTEREQEPLQDEYQADEPGNDQEPHEGLIKEKAAQRRPALSSLQIAGPTGPGPPHQKIFPFLFQSQQTSKAVSGTVEDGKWLCGHVGLVSIINHFGQQQ